MNVAETPALPYTGEMLVSLGEIVKFDGNFVLWNDEWISMLVELGDEELDMRGLFVQLLPHRKEIENPWVDILLASSYVAEMGVEGDTTFIAAFKHMKTEDVEVHRFSQSIAQTGLHRLVRMHAMHGLPLNDYFIDRANVIPVRRALVRLGLLSESLND